MNLLELARKWLKPGAVAADDDAAAERAAFQATAKAVWLEYHGNELWAQRKAEAGLVLTAEGLAYMERENLARRITAEHDAKLKAEWEKDNGTQKPSPERADDRGQRVEPITRPGTDGRPPTGDGTYRPESGAVATAPEAGGVPDSPVELAGE